MNEPIPQIFKNVDDAYNFLKTLGASDKLLRHVMLVGEASDLLIEKFKNIGLRFDESLIRFGVAFHDAGKILFPEELSEKGNRHEVAGQNMLLSHGVPAEIAGCCISHAQWHSIPCSFEELLVALADNLWKGKRNSDLEQRVINKAAAMIGKEPWDIYIEIDSHFEMIASQGTDRLIRS